MTATIYALPISRDKAEAVRQFANELLGPRREAFEESWRSKGMTREVVCLQATPDGFLALVYVDAKDPENAFRELAVSNTPFDRWYRDRVLAIYGVDLAAASGPPSEFVAEWEARTVDPGSAG
jgi:hypothetical protein